MTSSRASSSSPQENVSLQRSAGRGASLMNGTAKQIGLAIVSGAYAPLQNLPVEADIMKQYGVSRNVVREAVKTLAGKGLLRTVRRAGTIVEPRYAWNMLDADVLAWTMATPALKAPLLVQLTQLRVMIEPQIAALAALHATTTETLRLSEAYEMMERNRFDAQKAIDADIEFHRRLLEAAHNDLLSSMLPAFDALLRGNFELTIHSDNGFIRNLAEHRQIVEGVRLRDAAMARNAMYALLRNNDEDMSKVLPEYEQFLPTLSEEKNDP